MRPRLNWAQTGRKAYVGKHWEDNFRLYATVVFLPTKNRWTFTLTRFVDEYHEFDTHAECVNFIEALWALEDCNEDD